MRRASKKPAALPGDWRQRNIQVVVSTKVIGEEPGAPRVVAAHLW